MSGNTRPIIRRLEWIKRSLQERVPFNSSDICREFGVSQKTAHRDIATARDVYGLKFTYCERERAFYLDIL